MELDPQYRLILKNEELLKSNFIEKQIFFTKNSNKTLTQWLLYASRQSQQEHFIKCQCNMNGMRAIAIKTRQEFNCRFKLSS